MSTIVRWVTDLFFRNIFRDIGMKLIAIGLAAVLFVLTRDEVSKTFEVPLRVVPDPNRVLLTDVPDTVTVKVRGPWTRVNRLQDFDLGTAALDLRTAAPGPLDVDQASIVMPSGVLLGEVQYPHVDLRFEPVIERAKGVTPTLEGQPAEDYRVAAVTVSPPNWEVRGGRSLVQGIARLNTEALDISGRTSTTSQALAIVRPAGDVRLAGTGGAAPRVEVRVEIEAVTQTRDVSVPIAVPEDLDPLGRIKKTYQVEVSGPLPVFRTLDALGKQFPIDGEVVALDGTTDAGGKVVEIRFGWSDTVPEDVREALSIDHGVERIVLPPPPAPAPPIEPPA